MGHVSRHDHYIDVALDHFLQLGTKEDLTTQAEWPRGCEVEKSFSMVKNLLLRRAILIDHGRPQSVFVRVDFRIAQHPRRRSVWSLVSTGERTFVIVLRAGGADRGATRYLDRSELRTYLIYRRSGALQQFLAPRVVRLASATSMLPNPRPLIVWVNRQHQDAKA
jgi:hypothetical protein